MKFICLGYFDEARWATLTESEQAKLMEECMAYDDELRRGKHFIGVEALGSAASAVTLKMKNGAVEVLDGPFTETKEILGGILLLEAKDLNHAIALMAKHPGVKNGPFEIRCADETVNQQIAQRNSQFNTQNSGR